MLLKNTIYSFVFKAKKQYIRTFFTNHCVKLQKRRQGQTNNRENTNCGLKLATTQYTHNFQNTSPIATNKQQNAPFNEIKYLFLEDNHVDLNKS